MGRKGCDDDDDDDINNSRHECTVETLSTRCAHNSLEIIIII